MSRSYKKSGYYKRNDKYFKDYFNRVIRRSRYETYSRSGYKKRNQKWKICDFKYFCYNFNEFANKMYDCGMGGLYRTWLKLYKLKRYINGRLTRQAYWTGLENHVT